MILTYKISERTKLTNPHRFRNFLSIPAGCVSPASSGSVRINSSDPFSTPLIDPGLLTQDVDIAVLREAIRSARRFVAANAWKGYIITFFNNATTDDDLDEYIRENAVSFFHPVATSAMSPRGATHGVRSEERRVGKECW